MGLIKFYVNEAATSPQTPAVSGVTVGFHLCQKGWIVVRFDTRPHHSRDGEWTRFTDADVVKVPQWKRIHDAVQAEGGTFLLPNGKTKRIPADIACERLAAIYGEMIKGVLVGEKQAGAFDQLPKHRGFRIDVEEFDGMWAWPRNLAS